MMDHPNIIQYKHVRNYDLSNQIHEIKGKLYLGMELVKGGRLTDLIQLRKETNQPFSDVEASKMMRSLLSAIAYMHEKGIVHRDLKPDNILVSNTEDLSLIKVADFGLSAKQIITDGGLQENCGTLIYMAPEVIKYNEYTKSVDMWSAGIIMYNLLTMGSHPFY